MNTPLFAARPMALAVTTLLYGSTHRLRATDFL